MRKILLSLCLLAVTYFTQVASASAFSHPGLLHSNADLERMRQLVASRVEPAYGSWKILNSDSKSSSHYHMQGPFKNLARDGKYGFTKGPCENDFNAAYYNALAWCITGDSSHAEKAMEIIRAYARTTQDISGHDAPLCAALQGFIYVNAAELMRYTFPASEYANGWTDNDTQNASSMLRRAFLPVIDTFIKSKPYANGNWGIAVYKMMIGSAVFLDDKPMYEQAKSLYLHSDDNGSIGNYIAADGQLQESGRDQAHCMLGLGCLAEICEVAWKQGDDLYSALDNRLMKGYEYLSRYNLGYDVPFHTWADKTGRYCNWTTLGEASRGKWRSVFELPYNHYVCRRHLSMPYTAKVLGLIRPEGQGFTCDNPGFGSLLFYSGKGDTKSEEGKIDENPSEKWKGWNTQNITWRAVDDNYALQPPSLCISKRVSYSANEYPLIAVKVSKMPRQHNPQWLRLSYSVNSAPEFWSMDENDAETDGKDIYVFKIKGTKSNNGTTFPDKLVNIDLILDFGNTGGEGVSIDWIKSRSFEE